MTRPTLSPPPLENAIRKLNWDRLTLGFDYNSLVQGTSSSVGPDTAASGAARLYGSMAIWEGAPGDTGELVFKVENRHRLGTSIPPQAIGPTKGYAGLTAITFSDASWILSNFYWEQKLFENRLALVAGIVDVTDYVDVYGLVNPWTDFINLSFGTNPTIPSPDQGMGAAVRGFLTDDVYVLAGIADANGDPSRPQDSPNSFFSKGEYFRHAEIGWSPNPDRHFEDNVHLTLWQVDARAAADVDKGWGLAASASYLIGDHWLPFARAGWSDGGGGAFLERSVSFGAGRYLRDQRDMLGVGLNWGRPSEKTFAPRSSDQFTVEFFYRMQLFKQLTITPDIQLLLNPALNPDSGVIGVFGLRGRLVF